MTAKTRRAPPTEIAGRLETDLASVGRLADAIFQLGEGMSARTALTPAVNAICRLAWEIDKRAAAFVHGLHQVQTMPRPDNAFEIANGMDDDLSAIRDFTYALAVLSNAPALDAASRLAREIMHRNAAAERDFALLFGALHGRAAAA